MNLSVLAPWMCYYKGHEYVKYQNKTNIIEIVMSLTQTKWKWVTAVII